LILRIRRRASPQEDQFEAIRPSQIDDRLPIPPATLIEHVAGSPDVGWFLSGGRLGAETIVETLQRHGRRIEQCKILDFGCGCGRVTRYWAHLTATINGCDVSPDAVEWCRENLRFGRFDVNELSPPLAYTDGQFDLVYALSVLTHLPEDLQQSWTREFSRLVAPGGLVIVTTHGEAYREQLASRDRARFDRGELVVRAAAAAGSNACAAFHPPDYFRRLTSREFTVLEFVESGARGNPHQDLWLLQARGSRSPQGEIP
jgi:2-polyprenyl-3-methyl-5-hydroxy-6-metoxy-1,4-benzoquinol methylase